MDFLIHFQVLSKGEAWAPPSGGQNRALQPWNAGRGRVGRNEKSRGGNRGRMGFVCYGVPIGSKEYVHHKLQEKAQEVVKKVDILRADSQARLYRSIALKMDYHLSLSLSIGYQTSARFLGRGAVAGQQIPWSNQGLGFECMLDLPVEPTSVSTSFLSEPPSENF